MPQSYEENFKKLQADKKKRLKPAAEQLVELTAPKLKAQRQPAPYEDEVKKLIRGYFGGYTTSKAELQLIKDLSALIAQQKREAERTGAVKAHDLRYDHKKLDGYIASLQSSSGEGRE